MLGDGRLSDLDPPLQQLSMDTGRALQRVLHAIRRIRLRASIGILGRPLRERDFHRQ